MDGKQLAQIQTGRMGICGTAADTPCHDQHSKRSQNQCSRAKLMLAAQFAPVKEYLSKLPERTTGEPPGNLMLPSLLDEIGRNIIPSLP
jgi:hypothetical protein